MASPDEKEHELQRRVEARLREMAEKIHASEIPHYQTVKHQPEEAQKPWVKKAILAGKLFGLAVAALIAVRVASVLAGVMIVALLGWMAYKLFLESPKKKS
ncbi:MAG TPA: hypothetical protein VK203_27185 [Nostocaceae cyanobacterium]|nr:hypothetical protein [Nostocaceae cyanobacterium]